MTTPLLLPEERAALLEPRLLSLGAYHDSHKGSHELQMRLDASPLLALVDDVVRNRGVYEFMTIGRPGDVLPYLRLTLLPGDAFLEQELRDVFRGGSGEPPEPLVVEMDERLRFDGDDTGSLAEVWLRCRADPIWGEWLRELLERVGEWQQRLRTRPDLLLRKELALLDSGQHPRANLASIPRIGRRGTPSPATQPAEVAKAVVALVRELHLPAVAADEKGIDFWRALFTLQMQRADETGLAPMQALSLYASDRGLPLRSSDWGGEAEAAWEGMRMTALVVMPNWRVFAPTAAGESGSLHRGLRYIGDYAAPKLRYPNGLECQPDRCLVMVSATDYGELGCAWRLPLAEWVIYVDKALGVSLERLREIVETA